VTDHWKAIGRYLERLECEINNAKINAADKDEARQILRPLRLEYIQTDGYFSGLETAADALISSGRVVEAVAMQMTTAQQKRERWAQIMGQSIAITEICQRGRQRRPKGSKVSEDRDIMAAFTAYSRFKAGSAASLTAAIRSTIADEKAAGRPLAGNSDESTQKRISRAVGEFRSVFDSMWNEAHAGH
tara:strand:+ start:60484 stop:61047 length:564 start_codon:yes stop_codon:yes gene_type:complete